MRPKTLVPSAIAVVLLASILTLGGEAATGNFDPRVSESYTSTDPGSHPYVTTTYSLGLGPDGIFQTPDDTDDYNFAGIVSFSPASRRDADVPDGAVLGTLRSDESLAVINNPCVLRRVLDFTMLDASTDITNTVEPLPYGIFNDLGVLAGDTPPFNGVADVSPPPAVTKYPSYLNAMFDPDWVDFGPDKVAGNGDDTNGPQPPVKPRARSVGITAVRDFVSEWIIRQEVVFEPGTKLPNLPPFDPSLGYPIITVTQQRSVTRAATSTPLGLIPDRCTPLKYEMVSYGSTRDNPDTAQDEGGIPLLTLPDAGASLRTIFYGVSLRDADGMVSRTRLISAPSTRTLYGTRTSQEHRRAPSPAIATCSSDSSLVTPSPIHAIPPQRR